jgi:hypothetical protein
MPRSSHWSLTFRPPNQNRVNTSPLPHTCHMSHPPQPSWFNHPYNVEERVFFGKLYLNTTASKIRGCECGRHTLEMV